MAASADGLQHQSPARLPRTWIAVGVAYSASAMQFAPFTVQQYVATGLPVLAVVVIAVRRGWLRPGWAAPAAPVPRPPLVAALWLMLILVALAVQLFNFYDWPRTVYPTLSSLASQIFDIYPVRVIAFALWLRLGWYFLDR
jgi:ribose/xylose/arabinose/galactoside ABC-type transport system permease subunit